VPKYKVDKGEFEEVAIFMKADQTWYLNINGERVSLPKIISQLQKMQEYLDRSLS